MRHLITVINRRFSSVLFSVNNKCGVITLNRPKAINALNLDMVRQIHPVLSSWARDDKISHVVIEGSGTKGFCAGGDVQSVIKGSLEEGSQFFREEYHLNHLISIFKKPYIALIDGIVMGGGVGVSVHNKYRVSTEKSLFAMPETLIGLFPDVGGGYFLPRIPHKGLGLYLALTGHRLKGADLKHAGIATHHVTSNNLENMKKDLFEYDQSSSVEMAHKTVTAILEKYTTQDLPKFSLEEHLDFIEKYFNLDNIVYDDFSTIEKMIDSLKKDNSEFAQKCVQTLSKMSPISLKITLRQLCEGKKCKNLAEDLNIEFRLAINSLKNSDFKEGVRALLIDKDNSPQWSPNRLEDVTSRFIENFFSPLQDLPEWTIDPKIKDLL